MKDPQKPDSAPTEPSEKEIDNFLHPKPDRYLTNGIKRNRPPKWAGPGPAPVHNPTIYGPNPYDVERDWERHNPLSAKPDENEDPTIFTHDHKKPLPPQWLGATGKHPKRDKNSGGTGKDIDSIEAARQAAEAEVQ